MAPKSPWKKPAQGHSQHANPTKQPVAPSEPAGGSHVDYAQVQAEEIEVLQAIYMDDYQEVATKGAWKTSDKAFTLRLKASSDDNVYLVLAVRFTATYPKSLPLLSLEDNRQCNADILSKVDTVTREKPKELVGEVMIHEIAAAILDILEDAVQRRDKDHERSKMVPSLEEERARTEAVAAHLAQEEQARLRKLELAAKAEEERGLEDLVHREMRRLKEAKDRRERGSEVPDPGSKSVTYNRNAIDFQRRISLQETDFSAVDTLVNIRNGPVTAVYTAQPVTTSVVATSQSTLVVKKVNRH